ncbi:MAG: hypothetical protein IPI67_22350 [Myxococcales bacterium]|nr:hypothetical protein [Myxococcales bacterium]
MSPRDLADLPVARSVADVLQDENDKVIATECDAASACVAAPAKIVEVLAWRDSVQCGYRE